MPPTVTTFLFEAANFLVLAGVLGWLFFRPVRDAVDRRRQEQQRLADQAADKMDAAERMRCEIERQYSALEQELDLRREQATESAKQEVAQAMQRARESADRELEAVKRRIAHLDQAQQEKLARAVAEAAAAAVDRLLRDIGHSSLVHGLALAACREIRAFDGESLAPVRIESAQPLAPEDRSALLESLGKSRESAEFHLNENLGIGLRVSTNHGLIDVSSAGLAKFAERQLAANLVSNGIASEAGIDG